MALGSHGSTAPSRCYRHVGGVVFISKASEMMAELVHEDVGREGVVGSHSGVQVENAAASVLAAVDHDLDELVGRG